MLTFNYYFMKGSLIMKRILSVSLLIAMLAGLFVVAPANAIEAENSPSAEKICSFEEFSGMFPDWQLRYPNYNESFFNDNFLIVVSMLVPDYSSVLRVKSVVVEEDVINIEVKLVRVRFYGYPADMLLTAFQEMDQALADYDVSVTLGDATMKSEGVSALLERGGLFPPSTDGIASARVTSKEELDDTYLYVRTLSFDPGKYDESFFEDKYLYLLMIGESSGGNVIELKSVAETATGIEIEIMRTAYGMTADIGYWLLVLEVDRTLLDKVISVAFDGVSTKPERIALIKSGVCFDKIKFPAKVTSSEDLQDYSFYSDMSKYDEAFFMDKFLSVTHIDKCSSSSIYEVSYVSEDIYSIRASVAKVLTGNTADIVSWYAVIELDRSVLKKDTGATLDRMNSISKAAIVTGNVRSYNPQIETKVELYQTGTDQLVASTVIKALPAGSGQITQNFTIPNVPKGVFDLVVSKKNHLSYKMTGINVGTPETSPTARLVVNVATVSLLSSDVDGDGMTDDSDLIMYGDVDGDGSITPFDATLVLQHIVGMIKLDGSALAAADTDHDGDITPFDAALILQYVVGMITSF
jgi:hypothetical protein